MSQAAPQGGVLPQVVDFVASAVACDACFVYVLEGDDLVLRASTNPQSGAADRVKLKSGPEPAGWVAEQREPVEIAQQAGADPRFKLFNKLTDERFEAFLLVPLVCRGRLVGIINIQNREPRHYGEREIGLISTIGFLVVPRLRLPGWKSRTRSWRSGCGYALWWSGPRAFCRAISASASKRRIKKSSAKVSKCERR